MKFTKFATMALSGLMLASCGGGDSKEGEKKAGSNGSSDSRVSLSTDKKVEEARTVNVVAMPGMNVEGKDASYFSFTGEDGSSTITLTGEPNENGQGTVRATVVLTIEPLSEEAECMGRIPTLPLYVFNADKEQPGRYCRLEMSQPDSKAVNQIIESGKGGQLTITYKDDFYADQYDEIFNTAKYVQIQSAVISWANESDDDSSTTTTTSSSSSGDDDDEDEDDSTVSSSTGNNWDELLKEYEEYLDDYFDMLERANNGDYSAVMEANSLLSKAQSLQNKLQNAKNDLTAAQVKKLTDLSNKMAERATSMYNF